MAAAARELLESARRELAPGHDENRLVPLVARGSAPRAALTALAAEQHRIIPSDRRSFLLLAARSTDPAASGFFADLAQGEVLALEKLAGFAAACGLGERELRDYEPRAGCQAYPAYVAWLALNGEPGDVVLALVANFSAWGAYCATVARALREHYGFDDAGCAFFDFFAAPPSGGDEPALAVVQAALDAGRSTRRAREHGRLLQRYELMFWNTLAELA